MSGKLLNTLLDPERDNRLVISVGDTAKLVLWAIHAVEEVEIKFVLASSLRNGLKLRPNLPDIDKQRIVQREVKPQVDTKPVAKLISLSDSEEEAPKTK